MVIIANLRKYLLLLVAVGILLFAAPLPAFAIDYFTLDHKSGACGGTNYDFISSYFSWSERRRIPIASGETITATLYGNGADFAQDAIGNDIYENIAAKGTTTSYPDPPRVIFGDLIPKGYVKVKIWTVPSHGTGNRTVTVKWLTGEEKLNFKVVPTCNDLVNANYRRRTSSPTPSNPPSAPVSPPNRTPPVPPNNPPTTVQPATPNLLPSVNTPQVLTRPSSTEPQGILTPNGRMFRVAPSFCSNLANNLVNAVAVPKLTWGVIGVNIEAANRQFDVQLIDETNNRILDTLTLPVGFPANTPLVEKNDYPGRPTSIRVIKNPTFPAGSGTQTFVGCFTEPEPTPVSSQGLDPAVFLIRVDPDNRIDEGDRENDNELRF